MQFYDIFVLLDWYDTNNKCSINMTYFYFAKFALKLPLTLHGHTLSCCLGNVIHAASTISTSWIVSVNLRCNIGGR